MKTTIRGMIFMSSITILIISSIVRFSTQDVIESNYSKEYNHSSEYNKLSTRNKTKIIKAKSVEYQAYYTSYEFIFTDGSIYIPTREEYALNEVGDTFILKH